MLSILHTETKNFAENYSIPRYAIILLEDANEFSIDFVNYKNERNSILFLSPYQNLKWFGKSSQKIKLIEFHGDFYCIEYHKKEVACNGLLFNNIYSQPYILLGACKFGELEELIEKMAIENKNKITFSDSVLKSYLQLLLAICSREKALQIDDALIEQPFEKQLFKFQPLLEEHFIQQRAPSFYANVLAMSTSSFSKKVKQQFGKTPTKLIQERVVLEAKKQLHLTYKSVKEIATLLNFDDKYYFSRYFKKEVGLSPSQFRQKVGISVVAK
ncbi:AraC-like DNA-binding protein [Mesonia hippocampi]|uniref:AraC-like DNA-binding protein n=1 Tax=Mesonia hippocampi TaxID=1628250 RepID=A0A840EVS5_9FLAO|nr:helix-turn-helix domain-containing protein [Mesonia hippocampi]MBB4119626.1 AraC-like DNA-binding protein [Mesonia hippocampi]